MQRAFEDKKKVCDFCREPLIEIRETDGVKRKNKENPIVFCSGWNCDRIDGGTWNRFADNETACNWKK